MLNFVVLSLINGVNVAFTPSLYCIQVAKYLIFTVETLYLILDSVCICIPSAGAMRLPCRPKDPNKTHFLSDFYIQKFQLPVVDFVNENENGFLKFYNMPKVRMCGKAFLCDYSLTSYTL